MADARGFTLLEVLAVILLTSILIGLSLDFYVEMSRRTERASASTRDIRHAAAILDRVARDFEHAVLLRKAPDEDPLAHPWVFVAESRSSQLGADRIKFDTLAHTGSSSRGRESDLSVVAYVTRDSLEDDSLELIRWSSAQLPESLDRDFPLPGDDGAQLLAYGLADFGVRFLGEDGVWTDRWDSSTLVDSGELPLAVEIEVVMAGEEGPFGVEEGPSFSRMVLLPMRPIDLFGSEEAPADEAPADEPPPDELPAEETTPGRRLRDQVGPR